MQAHSEEFIEIVKAGAFIGPLTEKDQWLADALNAYTILDENGIL